MTRYNIYNNTTKSKRRKYVEQLKMYWNVLKNLIKEYKLFKKKNPQANYTTFS